MTQEHLPASIGGAVDLSALAARHQQAAAPQAAAEGAPGVVIDITDAELSQLVELSSRVPVIIAIVADWSEPSKQLAPVLERLVGEQRGRLVLARADADRSPQIVQAFQAQSVPTVAAVIAGRPAPLFSGSLPEDQLQDVLAQVLEFAAQQGITGTVPVGDAAEGDAPAEPAPAPVPPLHQEAYDAMRLMERDAADPAIDNNLGVVQMRRPISTPGGPALSFFEEARRLDPADADILFNAGYAYWLAGDVISATYWLREAVRRRSDDAPAHYVLGVALQAAGNAAEAAREKEAARRLSTELAEWDAKQAGANRAPPGLERVKTELSVAP